MIKKAPEDLVKVTTGGRITIPAKIRKEESIGKGDYVWIIVEKPSFEGPKGKTEKEVEEKK